MTKSLKALKQDLDITNKAIKNLETQLIKQIKIIGLEYIDLYTYINDISTLKTRKNLLMYQIALYDK